MANKGITQRANFSIPWSPTTQQREILAGQIIVDTAYPRGDNAWPMVEWAQWPQLFYAMGEVVRIPEPTNPSKSMDPPVAVPLGDLIGDLKQSGAERIKEFI